MFLISCGSWTSGDWTWKLSGRATIGDGMVGGVWSKQIGQQYGWRCLIYMECFDSCTRTPLGREFSSIATSCDMAPPRYFVDLKRMQALDMTGQKPADTHARVEKHGVISSFPRAMRKFSSLLKKLFRLDA